MTVSRTDYLNSLFRTTRALGDRAVNSDAYFEIEGFEDVSLLIQQFPWPKLSVGDAIEVPLPMGMNSGQPGQIQPYQQGPVTISETVRGDGTNLMENLLATGGRFNAKVYEGTPTNFTRVKRIVDCFIVLDVGDRAFENRGQLLTMNGTLHFHYFGDQ